MIIRTAGQNVEALLHKSRGQRFRVLHYLLLILFKFRFKCLPEAYCLACNDML